MNAETRLVGGRSVQDSPQDSVAQVLDVTNLLQLVRIRWLSITGIAVGLFLIATGVIFSLTPRYSAEAIVTLDQRTNTVTDTDAVLSKLSTDATTVQAQLQILRSRSFLSQVIDSGTLDNDPLLSPPSPSNSESSESNFISTLFTGFRSFFQDAAATQQSGQSANDAIIDALLRGLTVSPLGPAIRIEFRSPDPQQAARIANAIAEAYIKDQLNTKFEASATARKFLSDRVTDLGSQVRAAESALTQFRSTNDVAEPVQGQSSVEQQLVALNSQLVAAELNLSEQKAKATRIRELQSAGRTAEIAEAADSPLITQLRAEEADLQRQEAELSSKYGPRHPRIIDVESRKTSLARKIAEEVSRATQVASNEVDLADAKVRSLKQSLSTLEQRAAEENQSFEKMSAERNQSIGTVKQLEDRLASSRTLYEAALSRFNQIEDRENLQRPDARIISSASVPRTPNFPPNKVLMLGLAGPASIFLGFLTAIARELFVKGFRTSAQVEQSLTLPVITATPEVRGKAGSSVTNIVNDSPLSSFAESMRGIQLALCQPNIDHPPKVVLVTSSLPQEGKSTIALSLARSAARSGKKVVLIDCDLRRPSLRKMARARGIKKGLVRALVEHEKLEECLHKDTSSEVQFLVPEAAVENPAALIGSAEMENLLRDLRESMDLIIIDSAPLLPVNDTKLLIPLVDTMLLLVRWEKTPRNAVLAAVRSLFDLGAPIAGVVVTRADPRQYYGYNYGLTNYRSYAQYFRD